MLVLKSDTPYLQIVYGEVYPPDRMDAQGEFMRADEIRKMAHEFVRSKMTDQIDVMHDNTLVPCHIVESFIARKGDPDFLEGSWVIGMHIPDAGLWDRVLKGEINGFSMEAMVSRIPVDCEVDVPNSISGSTSKSEGHTHTFAVKYDDNGKFMGGETSVTNGHSHAILAGTHTERTEGHSHRFSSVDSMTII